MCVVAIAINAHPKWRLVVTGNRDEYHARASAPLARWNDGSGIIGGRDLVSGGGWMGISDAGRFAVVTNIRDADGPDSDKLSRGALVADWLAHRSIPAAPDRFNPFNLIVTTGDEAIYLSNRPTAVEQPLTAGIHGMSNAVPDEYWPRKQRLVQQLGDWLAAADTPDQLFAVLRDETIIERHQQPMFLNGPIYGTRCSSIIAVDQAGRGRFIERRFSANGGSNGETSLDFFWSPQTV